MRSQTNSFILKAVVLVIAVLCVSYTFLNDRNTTLRKSNIEAPAVDKREFNVLERSSDFLIKVVQAGVKHVKTDRSLIIFLNGTIVFIEEPTTQHVEESTVKLHRLLDKDVKFAAFPVEAGGYIVSFENSGICQLVLAGEVEAIDQMPLSDLRQYLRAEEQKFLPKDWSPTLRGKIGLVARSWLLSDIEEPKVFKILKAKPIESERPRES